MKALKLHAKDPAAVKKTDLAAILDKLCAASEMRETLRSLPSDVAATMTGLYMNEQTDWNALEKASAKTAAVMSAIRAKGGVLPAEIAGKLAARNC